MTIIVDTIASASTRDYDWLKKSIAAWNGNRSDLAALIPDFVMLAERRINEDLETNKQEAVISLALPASSASISLPADTSELRSIGLAGGGVLDYLPPATFNAKESQGTSGAPRLYTVIGRELYTGPLPDADYTLTLAYRQYVPALADSAGSNWLIEQHPNIYLSACMVEAIYYTKNFTDLQTWEAKYEAALEALNKSGSFTGTMRIRAS